MRVAEESEDVGTLQALDALDSLSSKLNQVQVAYQQFYTSIGAENVWKGALDGIRGFIDSLNDLPKVFDIIPISAVAVLYDAITLIRDMLLKGFSVVSKSIVDYLDVQKDTSTQKVKQDVGQTVEEGTDTAVQKVEEGAEKVAKATADAQDKVKNAQNKNQNTNTDGGAANQVDSTQQNLEVEKQRISTFFTERANYYKEKAEEYRQQVQQEEDNLKQVQAKVDLRSFALENEQFTKDGHYATGQQLQELKEKFIELAEAAGWTKEEINKALNEGSNNSKSEFTAKNLAHAFTAVTNKVKETQSSIEDVNVEINKLNNKANFADIMANSFSGVGNVIDSVSDKISSMVTKTGEFIKTHSSGLTDFSMALNVVANAMDKSTRGGQVLSGSLMGVAGAIKVINALVTGGANVWMAVAMGAITIVNGISVAIETTEEKLERLTKDAENLTNEAKRAKADYNTLQRTADKLDELKEKRYENEEAAKEYQAAIEELKDKMPGLITGLNEAGEATMDISNIEEELSKMREKSTDATMSALDAEIKLAQERGKEARRQAQNDREYIQSNAERWAEEFQSINPVAGFHLSNEEAYLKEAQEQGLSLKGQDNISSTLNEQIRSILYTSMDHGLVDSFISINGQIHDLEGLTDAFETYSDDFKFYGEETYKAIEEYLNYLKFPLEEDDEISLQIAKAAGLLRELNNNELSDSDFLKKINDFNNLMLGENLYRFMDEGMQQEITDMMKSYSTKIKNSNFSDEELRGYHVQQINTLLNDTYSSQSAFIEDQTLLISYLEDEYEAWHKIEGNEDKTIEDYMRNEGISKITEFSKSLEDTQWQIFNESWKNIDQYSFEDWAKLFGFDDSEESKSNPLYLALQNHYNTYRKTKERIDNQIKNITEKYGLENDYDFKGISEEMASFVTSGSNLVTTYLEKGYIDRGENVLKSIQDVFSTAIDVPQESYGAVSNILKNMSFTTEGINETIKNLEDVEGTEQVRLALETLKTQLIINLPLSIQTAADKISSEVDSAQDSIKKAFKGFKINEISAVLEKIDGWSVNDLILKNGEYYLPADAREAYISAIISELTDTGEEIKTEVEELFAPQSKSSRTLYQMGRLLSAQEEPILLSDLESYSHYDSQGVELAKQYGAVETYTREDGKEYIKATKEFLDAIKNNPSLSVREFIKKKAEAELATLENSKEALESVRNAAIVSSKKESQEKINDIISDFQKGENEFISKESGDLLNSLGKDIIELETLEDGSYQIKAVNNYVAISEYLYEYLKNNAEASEEQLSNARQLLFDAKNKQKTAGDNLINSIQNLNIGEALLLDQDQFALLSEQDDKSLKEMGLKLDRDAHTIELLENASMRSILTFIGRLTEQSQIALNKIIAKGTELDYNFSPEKVITDVIKDLDNISDTAALNFETVLKIDEETFNQLFERYGDHYKATSKLLPYIQQFTEENDITITGYLADSLYDASKTIADKLRDVGKQIGGGIGDEVNKEAVSILQNAGYKIEQIESRYFITSIGDLEQAYLNFYQTIIDTNDFSEAEINEARQNIIDAHNAQRLRGNDIVKNSGELQMGEWMNLSDEMNRIGINPVATDRNYFNNNFLPENYNGNVDLFRRLRVPVDDSYGTIYSTWENINGMAVTLASITKEGVLLSDKEINGYIDDLRASGAKTEEEIKAYDAQHLNLFIGIGEDLGEHVHNLQEEWDNIVFNGEEITEEEMQKYDAFHNLEDNLAKVGAYIEDGILKTTENSDPLGIQKAFELYYAQLIDAVDDPNIKAQNQRLLAQTQDNITTILNSYTDLISKAISGSLTSTQALDLQKFASNYGIEIDFHETEEGLKASQKSAMDLYLTMKDVDYLQSRVVFKDLSNNLKESSAAYQDIVSIQGHIAKLQKEINNLPVGSARRQEYERELEVAKEIRETRSLTDEDAFNFMDRDLPTPYKAQLGYWDSIGSAFKEMNDAADTGYMDVQKFYNMVNGFNEMAKNMGSSITFMGMELDGSSESAAKAIQKGFNSLANVDGEGAKVSMEKWGADIYDGAADMQKNVKKGVREMAKSQIEFLDAQIAMLELVVAMEQLEPVDKDNDNKISFEELWPKFVEGEKNYLNKEGKEGLQNILDAAKTNKDLANALDTFQIDGKNMRYWMEQAIQGNISNKKTAQVFQATLSSFYTALKTGDFSPESIKKNIITYLQENINEGEWREFTLTDGTKVKVSKKGYIEQDKKNSKWYVNGSGKGYDTYEEAIDAANKLSEFEKATGITDGQISDKTGKAYKQYDIEDNIYVRVTENAKGEINTVLTYDNKRYAFDGVDMRSAAKQIIAEKMGLNGGFAEESDLLEMDLISKLNLTLDDVEVITGENAGQLSDKTLEALGIDTTLVDTIKTGIQRAFEDSNFNLIDVILGAMSSARAQARNASFKASGGSKEWGSLVTDNPQLLELGRQLADGVLYSLRLGITSPNDRLNISEIILDGLIGSASNDPSKWKDNPKLQWVGNQLGQGIIEAVKQGVTDKNDENPDEIPNAVAEGVKDENGVVKDEGETLGDTLVATLTSLAEPSGPMKLAGMDAAQAFVDGFTLTGRDLKGNDTGSVFGEVFGQQISNAVIPPIQNALKELFSETSLAEIIPLFETNSELTLAFDSIKIDSLTTLVEGFQSAISTAVETLSSLKKSIDALPDKSKEVGDTATAMKDLPDKSSEVNNTADAMRNLPDKSYNVNSTADAMNRLESRHVTFTGDVSVSVSVNGAASANVSYNANFAKGNVALAKGHNTLMGELGPELYVTGGRYYVAGQNGAEMVDLPDDAIVFNHLQTKRLLGTGHAGRGKPVTNEKNAVSFATGNAGGPAMATAQETLAQLKALRAMWQSMLNASFKDLGGLARSAKDTEKSKSGNTDKTDKETELRLQRIVKDVERWYNLERQIAKIDKDIAYSEKLINKYQNDRVVNGNEIYNTYKTQLKLLDSEIDKNRELVQIQRDWYDEKRAELDNSVFGLFMSYDENGLQQLKNMDILEKLQEQTVEGEGINSSYSVREQVALLASLGADIDSLLYDNSDVEKYQGLTSLDHIYDKEGNMLEGQDLYDAWAQIMNNFYSELEDWKGTMDSAYDGMHETEEKIIDEVTQQNQILQTLVDNQIEVENTVLEAIVDSREAEIDELQKMRDAYEESVNQMVDGLSEALDNERKIYEESQDQTELTKLQRQLAILQRSGGSASQIRNLQDQINSKQQDMYFDARQKEIDAIQTAADKQIERMDTQIDLMTETLEYQKEHGLLWDEVYQVMSRSEAEIERFIVENGAEWSSKSHLQKQEDTRALIEKIQLWTQKRDDRELEQIATKVDNASVTTANRSESSFSKVEKKELTPWTGGLAPAVGEVEAYFGDDGLVIGGKKVETSTSSNKTTTTNTTNKKKTSNTNNNYKYTAGGSTGHLNEGSTMTYSYSNGKYRETGRRIGHTGESVTVLQTDGEKSLVEYNGSQYWIKTKRIAYKNGGLIDFTGPAWVDGSKSKPEAILSAADTAILRENLLETKVSLPQISTSLQALQDLLTENNRNDTNNIESGNTYIEKIEFTMNAEIKDGYSAKRAGQQVFDEFVHLARKNGVNSLSRR